MHGEKVGRQLRMPAEFDIFYMYQGAQNSWYPMIHSCVCKSVKTTYGPGGEHQSFRPIDGSPPPTEINLALEFMETEIITKEVSERGILMAYFEKFPLYQYDLEDNTGTDTYNRFIEACQPAFKCRSQHIGLRFLRC